MCGVDQHVKKDLEAQGTGVERKAKIETATSFKGGMNDLSLRCN